MKKWNLILIVTIAIGLSFGSLVSAEETQAMANDPGQEQGMMGGGQGKPHPKMMGMMNKDSLVATSDGGVVLMQGPRLLKYDKDLTLVKEIELPRGKAPGRPEMKNEPQEGTANAPE